jgi:hypothetical protein
VNALGSSECNSEKRVTSVSKSAVDSTKTSTPTSTSLLSSLLGDFKSQTDGEGQDSSSVASQVKKYVDEPACPMDDDPLQWWKKHAHNYPDLHNYAVPHFLCTGELCNIRAHIQYCW